MDNTPHIDALVSASEARHQGGSHELSDAGARYRRAKETFAAASLAYRRCLTDSAHGLALDAAEQDLDAARAAFVALGGEE